jgi:carbonic anhydrase/acetyltransferase-like protein (isoleucine patch superfamily)
MTKEKKSLESSLARMIAALGLTEPAVPAVKPARDRAPAVRSARDPLPEAAPRERSGGGSEAGAAFGVLAIVLAVAAARTHEPYLWVLMAGSVATVAAVYARRVVSTVLTTLQGGPVSSTHASIGLGATVDESAVIEPGASVEMGATIGRGAIVRSGAVVRMGATIEQDAVIEQGAIVSWGAVVNRGAVVGEGAVVGAGSVVQGGSRVPPGMRLSPGAVFATGVLGRQQPGDGVAALPAPEVAAMPAVEPPRPIQVQADPRDQRLAAVCDKLEAELRASPEQVRAFLGGSDLTIASLRRTCEDLSRRERAMREEANPESVARLEEDRAALEKRIASEHDAQLGQSLRGAISAIDELKRQRELLRVGAERLQAEHTRLLYTLEGLASQLVRLRTAGATTVPAELSQGALDLRVRIDAIADALEEVSRDAPAAMRELATGPADAGEAAASRGVRSRDLDRIS